MQFGLPYLTDKFKWIPAEFWQVVKDILKYVQQADNKKEAVKTVRSALSSCEGLGCPQTLKGNS